MFSSETALLYDCVVHVPVLVRDECLQVLVDCLESVVGWAHSDIQTIPSWASREERRIMSERLPFWSRVNTHDKENGPLPPTKLFEHKAQSFYSKTKRGVDGATQYRSIFRSCMVVLRWEQKLIVQTIKSVVANAYILFETTQRMDLLNGNNSFPGIEKYRVVINLQSSFGNFTFDLCPQLLRYADGASSERQTEDSNISNQIITTDFSESTRLHSLVSQKHRNRLGIILASMMESQSDSNYSRTL